MNDTTQNQTMIALSDDLDALYCDLNTLEKEITECKEKGWLRALFPLQVEYAITMIKIKSLSK